MILNGAMNGWAFPFLCFKFLTHAISGNGYKNVNVEAKSMAHAKWNRHEWWRLDVSFHLRSLLKQDILV